MAASDVPAVPPSCSSYCLDECQTRCAPVAETLGTSSADNCILQCTDTCVPACAAIEAEGGHIVTSVGGGFAAATGRVERVDKAIAPIWATKEADYRFGDHAPEHASHTLVEERDDDLTATGHQPPKEDSQVYLEDLVRSMQSARRRVM